MAALKGDWKLPVKRRPPPKAKPQATPENLPSQMSDEEWEKGREKTRAILDEVKKSLRGVPRNDASAGS
jgi:hypothetical protein